jgi:hypothetical protein
MSSGSSSPVTNSINCRARRLLWSQLPFAPTVNPHVCCSFALNLLSGRKCGATQALNFPEDSPREIRNERFDLLYSPKYSIGKPGTTPSSRWTFSFLVASKSLSASIVRFEIWGLDFYPSRAGSRELAPSLKDYAGLEGS